MNILVLAGGYSPERDVSLTSGSLIANALKREGEKVCLADVYLGIDPSELEREDLFNTREGEVYRVGNSVPDLDRLKAESGNGEALIGRGIIELCRLADVDRGLDESLAFVCIVCDVSNDSCDIIDHTVKLRRLVRYDSAHHACVVDDFV